MFLGATTGFERPNSTGHYWLAFLENERFTFASQLGTPIAISEAVFVNQGEVSSHFDLDGGGRSGLTVRKSATRMIWRDPGMALGTFTQQSLLSSLHFVQLV